MERSGAQSATVACMTRTIAQQELRNDNAEVIDAVVAGETFVVTRHGVPVAELRPIAPPRRTFVARAGLVALGAAGPHVDLGELRADLDHIVDQSL
jgi:prevent-host-death family protein